MHKLTGSCQMCGTCCKAIVLPVSHDELKEYGSVREYLNGGITREDLWNDDPIFIYLNWKPITKEEAFEINPRLKVWENISNGGVVNKMNFWTCTKHDPITNICLVHENRPRVCRGFPWYGVEPTSQPLYTKDCGYMVDIRSQELPT